jgi:hypothetical protein
MNLKLEQLKFPKAFECRISIPGGAAELKRVKTHPADAGEGCYVVTVDSQIAYIGSYRFGLQRRWGYKNKEEIYHFKRHCINDAINSGKMVTIWAATLHSIKDQIGFRSNKWINAASVEAYLISHHQPIWNKQGKAPAG